MNYKYIQARCLFCRITVEANQESIAGRWDYPDGITPEWRLDKGRIGRQWLWYGAGCPDSYQDFYLCPEHNTPHHFHAAMNWADSQLKKGDYVDFTAINNSPLLSPQVGIWVESSSILLDKIPELNDRDKQTKMPNNWQRHDSRLTGCLEISYAIVDTWDMDKSPSIIDRLALDSFLKPLELAEAMEKAARRIKSLTKETGQDSEVH